MNTEKHKDLHKGEEMEKLKSIVYGHIVGDALGVPAEFSTREELKKKPIKDMVGYGTYNLPKGTWSDDTSMSLCTMEALKKSKTYNCIMENFSNWLNKGDFTPYGKCFDVGGTCYQAINNFVINGNFRACGLNDLYSNGNGSLMRIYPATLFALNYDLIDDRINEIHNISSLTHAHEISLIGCGIYSFILWELLKCADKKSIKKGIREAFNFYKNYEHIHNYRRLMEIEWYNENSINSSGYIVDTLEASLWCILTTNSYKEAVLKAVNLGGDTDTIGAVTGSLAGALYGYDAIPKKWIKVIPKKDFIDNIIEDFRKEI